LIVLIAGDFAGDRATFKRMFHTSTDARITRLTDRETLAAISGGATAPIDTANLKSFVDVSPVPSNPSEPPVFMVRERSSDTDTRHYIEIYREGIEPGLTYRIALMVCPGPESNIRVEALDQNAPDGQKYARLIVDFRNNDVQPFGDIEKFGEAALRLPDSGCAADWQVIAMDMRFSKPSIVLALTLNDKLGNLMHRGADRSDIRVAGFFLQAVR
jgi:hypothetical protein